jgi:hypothetical protein
MAIEAAFRLDARLDAVYRALPPTDAFTDLEAFL